MCCAVRRTAPGVILAGMNRPPKRSAISAKAIEEEAGPTTMPGCCPNCISARTRKAVSWSSTSPVSSIRKQRSPGESMKTPIRAFTARTITPISSSRARNASAPCGVTGGSIDALSGITEQFISSRTRPRAVEDTPLS